MSWKDAFPHLEAEGFTETSHATPELNCIAWAAGQTDVAWWPDDFEVCYWPEGVGRAVTLEAFYPAFESLGYVRCAGGDLEEGFEKLALHWRDGKPTHAARQLPSGSWTSRPGKWIDVTHTLRGVAGPVYGQVAGFPERPRPAV